MGAEVAPSHPATIGTVWVGAKVHRRVDLAGAPPRGDDARGWSCGGLGARVSTVRTGVAVRLGGEARTGGGLTVALWYGGWKLRWRRAHGGGVAGPRPLEQEAQPHQGDEP